MKEKIDLEEEEKKKKKETRAEQKSGESREAGLEREMAREMNRRCSHCGKNGHNSRTCSDKGLKLFGVRILTQEDEEDVMRKSASMGNLASLAAPERIDHGYLSDGLVNSSGRGKRERKRGN